MRGSRKPSGPVPNCECHDVPMLWNQTHVDSGNWRCRKRYHKPAARLMEWEMEERKLEREFFPFPFVDVAWQDKAACIGVSDPEIFFPERGQNATRAQRVCAPCPVKVECLDYANKLFLQDGVFGGASATDRRRMRHEEVGGGDCD